MEGAIKQLRFARGVSPYPVALIPETAWCANTLRKANESDHGR